MAIKHKAHKNIFNTAVYFILLLFPFMMGAVYGAVNLICGWEWLIPGHARKFYVIGEFRYPFLAVLTLAVSAAAIYAIIRLVSRWSNTLDWRGGKFSPFIAPAVLFLVCVGVRIVLPLLYRGQLRPFSDFENAWNLANGIDEEQLLTYYNSFPAYVNFAMFERIFSSITGGRYTALLCFGAFCNGVTAVFIFFITRSIFKNFDAAVLASLLYSLNPTGIVYVVQPTPEHMAIALYAASVYLIIRAVNVKNTAAKLACLAAAGALGGVAGSVKTFFPVILIAAALAGITAVFNAPGARLKKALFLCAGVALVFFSQKAALTAVNTATEKTFGVRLNFADSVPHFLYVGLNKYGEGQTDVGGKSQDYWVDRRNGMSAYEAKNKYYARLKEEWEGEISNFPAFLAKKTIWIWQDDYRPFNYYVAALKYQPYMPLEIIAFQWLTSVGTTYAQMWYIAAMALGVFASVMLLKRNNAQRGNAGFLFTNLIILGYFCMTLLSEGQSRYKCLIIPYLCITDAYALFKICGFIKRKTNKTAKLPPQPFPG